MSILPQKSMNKAVALLSAMIVMFLFAFSVRAESVSSEEQNAGDVGEEQGSNEQTGVIFINNSAKVSDVSAFSGNVVVIYEKQDEIAELKITRKTTSKGVNPKEYAHTKVKKENRRQSAAYNQIQPFGSSALISGTTTENAVLPVQNTHFHKIICLKTYKSPHFISEYVLNCFEQNTVILLQNNDFACAFGNLPPPSQFC